MKNREVVKLLEEEIIRCRMAPKINGCQMTDEWKRTIEVCEIAIDAIKAQEERRWIQVTERLPQSEGTYLVCSNRGSVYASHFYEEKVFRDGYVREPQWSNRGNVTVTHWMPLPQPPKGE